MFRQQGLPEEELREIAQEMGVNFDELTPPQAGSSPLDEEH